MLNNRNIILNNKNVMFIKGAQLHNKQYEIFESIINSNAKYFAINASRQSGKSYLLAEIVRYFCLSESNIKLLYVTPTYSLADIFFTNILESLEGIPIIKSINKSKLILKFNNGSTLSFKSAERYDNIRGLSIDYLLMDEFAYYKPQAWTAIKPVVAAKKNAKVILVSTPRGMNLFYDMSMLGQSSNPRYEYYFMHYNDNPMYDIEEVEDAKKVMADDIYRQEYEAEFIEDGGMVFKDIDKVQNVTEWLNTPNINESYFAGLDVGKTDSTVLTIMDKDGKVVYIHRVNSKSYSDIINELVTVLIMYNPLVYVEVNGVGDVLFDMLQLKYSRLVTWTSNNTSKKNMIELLMADFDGLQLPTKELLPELDFELKVFTYDYNPKTRTIKYAAMIPHHDDTIISLGLANLCRTENKFNGQRIIKKRYNKHSY